MEGSSFWLIYIRENQVSVSLVSNIGNNFQILATGPQKDWNQIDSESLIKCTDESLSVASINANITEDQEPSLAAFVVPPFWVGNDSKILPNKLRLIKELCKEMSFSPTGFLAEDEALVEDSNKADGFPSSFILVHLDGQEFYLSLVYLGHIKERVRKSFTGEFNGQILESALLEIKTESTLPPQIIVFGQTDQTLISSLKNYPWIGKKNVETFLHLPDVSLYTDNDLITLFTRVIASQMSGNISPKIDQPIEEVSNKPTVEIEPATIAPPETKLTEISPEDLGFNTPAETEEIKETENLIADQIPEPNLDPFEPPIVLPTVLPQDLPLNTPYIGPLPTTKKRFDFFKKIKLPKIKVNFNFFWLILIILPFLALLPFIFLPANITLFITPYNFEKTVNVTLKTDASDNDISSSIIPVQKETFDIGATATVATTGQKTIGDKAKGTVIIYNKLDKKQDLPKGSILTDSSGKKFELTTVVSVAASSSSFNDQNNLVTVSGQTEGSAAAADIGSEYNLASGTQLSFKDYPSIIAKVGTNFSGGSKQQVKAVSSDDKTEIQSKIKDEISKTVENKVQQTGNLSGVIPETIQSDQGNLDLSREVGEAAEELTGTVTASVSVFTLSDSTKEKVLKQFLSDQTDFDKIKLDPKNFTLSFKVDKITSTQATASLTITGKSLPTVDIGSLQKTLSVKTIKQAGVTIKKFIPRAYNFNINTRLPLLPFNPKNINIEID